MGQDMLIRSFLDNFPISFKKTVARDYLIYSKNNSSIIKLQAIVNEEIIRIKRKQAI